MHPNASKILRSAGILPAPYLETGETPVLRIENFRSVGGKACAISKTGETPVLQIDKNGMLLAHRLTNPVCTLCHTLTVPLMGTLQAKKFGESPK